MLDNPLASHLIGVARLNLNGRLIHPCLGSIELATPCEINRPFWATPFSVFSHSIASASAFSSLSPILTPQFNLLYLPLPPPPPISPPPLSWFSRDQSHAHSPADSSSLIVYLLLFLFLSSLFVGLLLPYTHYLLSFARNIHSTTAKEPLYLEQTLQNYRLFIHYSSNHSHLSLADNSASDFDLTTCIHIANLIYTRFVYIKHSLYRPPRQ